MTPKEKEKLKKAKTRAKKKAEENRAKKKVRGEVGEFGYGVNTFNHRFCLAISRSAKTMAQIKEAKWNEKGFFHPAIDWLREKPFFWLPNWNYEKKGVIVEILTIVILWTLIIYFLPFLKL